MPSQDRSDRADQLLTVADIAGHVGSHEQTVRGWSHRDELTASTFGARIDWRVRRADYDGFLRLRQLTGASARRLISLGADQPNPAT